MNSFYRLIARSLTLGRIAATFPFVYLLLQTPSEPHRQQGVVLGLAFLAIAGSDLMDGFFARLARSASHSWGQLDALADILFNTSSLLVAVWLGLMGIWVPIGVVVLAGFFIRKNRQPEGVSPMRLSEDRLGKAAGVTYYLLVGAAVWGIWMGTETARMIVWWLGNLVFAYTSFVLLRNWITGRHRPFDVSRH